MKTLTVRWKSAGSAACIVLRGNIARAGLGADLCDSPATTVQRLKSGARYAFVLADAPSIGHAALLAALSHKVSIFVRDFYRRRGHYPSGQQRVNGVDFYFAPRCALTARHS